MGRPEAGFAAKYDHGIYKYRDLGVGLLRITCQAINAAELPTSAPKILQKADPTFTKEFYSAFFYMNTLLLCLTTSVLVVIVSCLGAGSASPVADLVIVVLLGMMVLAQYVSYRMTCSRTCSWRSRCTWSSGAQRDRSGSCC